MSHRWLSSFRRRIAAPQERIRLAALFAVVAVVGAYFALSVGTAFAHANAVTGTATCQRDGTSKITWTVVNDFGLSETADLTSNQAPGPTPTPLEIGANGTGTATQTLPGSTSGIVTVTADATWSDGYHDFNSGSVTLSGECGRTTLSATTRLSGSWTRSVSWTIDKTVNDQKSVTLNLFDGDSQTVTYKITLTKGTVQETASLSGQTCVTNTGPTFATQGLAISNTYTRLPSTNLGIAPVSVAAKPVLNPGESFCYPFTFNLASPQAATYQVGSNVTITNLSGPAPHPTATTALVEPPTTNDTINITDTNGAPPQTVFSASGSTSYDKTFSCPGDAGVHPNTATITQTNQTSSANVNVTCGTTTVQVIKRVDGQPAPGWTFAASADPPATVNSPASGQTGAGGDITFSFGHVASGGSSVTLTETPQDGYSFDSSSCLNGTQPVVISQGTAGTLAVKPGDHITCTFDNVTNKATVTVVKHIGVGTTDTAGWAIDGSVPDSGIGRFTNPNVTNGGLNASGATTGDGHPPLVFSLDHVASAGTPVSLVEEPQAGFSFADFACEGGGAITTSSYGGSVVVHNGQNVVCTFVNTPAGVGLTKTPSPSSVTAGSNVTFTLTATNTTSSPLNNMVFTDQLDAAFTFVSSPDGCTAVAQLVTCGPYFILPATIDPGQTKTVSFVVRGGASVPAGTVIPNTANVTADPANGPPVSATAPATVNVIEVSPEVVTRPGTSVGAAAVSTLPFTGSTTMVLLKSALWFLALGAVGLFVGRRRRRLWVKLPVTDRWAGNR